MTKDTLYWQFDDQNPVFKYGPGWSNTSDSNAHDSTLSYTSKKTNVTIEFYGKSMWLYGVIAKTEDWDQPVYRYTLDSQTVSTVVAEPKNQTSYNELLAHLYGLNASYHTLLVENINEGAVLFLDYYLVEPVPPSELAISKVVLPTGGETLTTSISERPMIAMTTNLSLSGNALIGLILGVVVGVVGAILIAIAAFVLCKRRRNAKPYYYQSAEVYDVLSDEFDSHKHESKRDLEPEAPEDTTQPSYPSSVYSLNDNRASTHSLNRNHPSTHSLNSNRTSTYSLFSRPSYFPLPSEYRSQNLPAKSNSLRSVSSTISSSTPGAQSPRNSVSSQERRPLL